jgi:aspartate carbamoyltransferase regulatory subunit
MITPFTDICNILSQSTKIDDRLFESVLIFSIFDAKIFTIMSELKKGELVVSAIKNGTAIDRIPPQSLFKVISILGLEKIQSQITFGNNLDSKKLGKKAIIKITDKYFDDKEINKIALVAPEAKLNTIRDYKVVEKREVAVPDEVSGIVRCVNPKCITNNEQIVTKFYVLTKRPVTLKCHYCEKMIEQEQMTIL